MARDVHTTNVETVLPDNTFIYSQTDLKGVITEANQAFADLSGYSVDELLGQPHSIVRHPDMPQEAFADLWKSLKAGRPWQGLVKNRRKDGGFYWVVANASPVRQDGRIVGYQSLRGKPTRQQIQAVSAIYERVRQGDASIRIEDGRAFANYSAVGRRVRGSRFQLQAGWSALLLICLSSMVTILAADHPSHWLHAQIPLLGVGAIIAFAQLATIIPRQLRHISEIEEYLDALLSSGDLRKTFESSRQDNIGRIGRKLNLFISWVQSTVLCINDATAHVRVAADEVARDAKEIRVAAQTQNVNTASIAAAATELELTIREVSQHLQSTQSTVDETGRKATDGATVSQRATDQIQTLAQAVQGAAGDVEALSTSSDEVGAIAGVIREIANQTNLLALNASIEAARAGEAGRGFAVVANEVRRLADRTTEATAKIDSLILNIRNDSERAVGGMRTGAQQVDAGLMLVQDAQHSLTNINDLMSNAVRMVAEIATASSQQTEAMRDISTNISSVASMTEQTVAAVENTTDKIEYLTPMVERVRKAVAQYEA